MIPRTNNSKMLLLNNKKKSKWKRSRKKCRKKKQQKTSKQQRNLKQRRRDCRHGNKNKNRNYRKSRSRKKTKKINPLSNNPLNFDFSGSRTKTTMNKESYHPSKQLCLHIYSVSPILYSLLKVVGINKI